jgi:GxxExxY protein
MLTRVHSLLPERVERTVETAIGCAIEVHRRLGPGFLEGVYHDAMAIELEVSGLLARREVPVVLSYRDRPLREHRLDLVVEDCVILELKAVERLERIHRAQVISYLRASGLRVGLLINFNTEQLKSGLRRIVL